SDGCAPTPSQYCARSETTSMKDGSSLGWYLPISSMTRPSRFLRESTTTMRYCGTRILPRRFKRILTATSVVSPCEVVFGVRLPRARWGPPTNVSLDLHSRMRGAESTGLSRDSARGPRRHQNHPDVGLNTPVSGEDPPHERAHP